MGSLNGGGSTGSLSRRNPRIDWEDVHKRLLLKRNTDSSTPEETGEASMTADRPTSSSTPIPLNFSLPDVDITEARLVLIAKALPSMLVMSLIMTSDRPGSIVPTCAGDRIVCNVHFYKPRTPRIWRRPASRGDGAIGIIACKGITHLSLLVDVPPLCFFNQSLIFDPSTEHLFPRKSYKHVAN